MCLEMINKLHKFCILMRSIQAELKKKFLPIILLPPFHYVFQFGYIRKIFYFEYNCSDHQRA